MRKGVIVYVITNVLNGKRYIGLTSRSLAKRWLAHKSDARRGSRSALHRAIRKYGEEAFRVSVLASLMPNLGHDDLRLLERDLIAQEGTFSFEAGYNRNPGGDGLAKGATTSRKGKPLSEEQRAKLREAWARNPDRRSAQAERNRKGHSPETRAKITAANLKPERVEALRARNAVMNQSAEHKAKLKAAWARSPERRAEQAARMHSLRSVV